MSKNHQHSSSTTMLKCKNCNNSNTSNRPNSAGTSSSTSSNNTFIPTSSASVSSNSTASSSLPSSSTSSNPIQDIQETNQVRNTTFQESLLKSNESHFLNNPSSSSSAATNNYNFNNNKSVNGSIDSINTQKNLYSNNYQSGIVYGTTDISDLANGVNNPLIRNACIIERLSSLYLKESLADVHFIVGGRLESSLDISSNIEPQNMSSRTSDKQEEDVPLRRAKSISSSTLSSASIAERIPAHKLILSIGSQVFMAMFYGTGSHMLPATEIEIPDAEPEPFKNMLRYLYTDELHIEPDSVMSTLYVAKKYAVDALERECVNFLKTNLRPDNAFMLLQQALLFDEPQLADLCLNIIDKNSCEAFASECFLDVDLDTLTLVLKRDTLGIREFKLYYFLLKWAQNKCLKQNLTPINRENQQMVLGDAIKYIRFPLMSKEEFALAISDPESRVIDDESIIELFVNLTLSNNTIPPSLASNISNNYQPKKLKYNDTPRCCLGGKEQIINRFSQVESRWGYSGTSDRVKFSVNRRIYVVGFGLYGSIYGKCEYQAVIQLIDYDSCTTCAQNSTTFTCDGTNSTFKVLFKEPVEIAADTDYIASATLKGPDSFYGTKGLRKVTHESDSGVKVTFQFQYASGNNNGTSVEDGQIPEIIFLYSCS